MGHCSKGTLEKYIVIRSKYKRNIVCLISIKISFHNYYSSSFPIGLTETEAEYYVQCIKHIFKLHVVLQFDCTNTLNDQLLERVLIDIELENLPYKFVRCLIIDQLCISSNVNGTVYVILESPKVLCSSLICVVTPIMRFSSKDCDPITGEPESEGTYRV